MKTIKFEHLNLGNNFTIKHLIDAIKETNFNPETLHHLDLNTELIIEANLNFGYKLKETFDLFDFLAQF